MYIPSILRWAKDGAQVALTQKSLCPFEAVVQFDVKTSKPREFTLSFRIPAWAKEASIAINGRREKMTPPPGSLAAVHRQWRRGDRVELDLPMTTRIEPLDRQRPETVALLFGPLVLFAITDNQPALRQADLLAAKRMDQRSWQVSSAGASIKMVPFTDIGEEQYSTYLRVT